eukprot:944622_1
MTSKETSSSRKRARGLRKPRSSLSTIFTPSELLAQASKSSKKSSREQKKCVSSLPPRPASSKVTDTPAKPATELSIEERLARIIGNERYTKGHSIPSQIETPVTEVSRPLKRTRRDASNRSSQSTSRTTSFSLSSRRSSNVNNSMFKMPQPRAPSRRQSMYSGKKKINLDGLPPRRRTISEVESQRGKFARAQNFTARAPNFARNGEPKPHTESAGVRIRQVTEDKKAAEAKVSELRKENAELCTQITKFESQKSETEKFERELLKENQHLNERNRLLEGKLQKLNVDPVSVEDFPGESKERDDLLIRWESRYKLISDKTANLKMSLVNILRVVE